jgi:hypothetical protein
MRALLGHALLFAAGCASLFGCARKANQTENNSAGAQDNVLNCNQNLTCYIDAAKRCQKAGVTLSADVDFGTKIHSVTYNEMRGLEGGDCVVYQKILEQDVEFSPTTSAEHAEKMRAEVRKRIGYDGTCRYPPAEYAERMTDHAQGRIRFSTDDPARFKCTGPLYEPSDVPSEED